MRFIPYRILEGEHYLYSIETPAKPDSLLRPRIENSINEAMEAVKYRYSPRRGDSAQDIEEGHKVYDTRWRVEVTKERGAGNPGSEELPVLERGGSYIIFGIVQSDPEDKDQLSEQELENLRDRTAEHINYLRDPGEEGAIALVILQDCTVSRHVIPGPKVLFVSEGIFF
jgi:hypothetical protein